MDQHRDGESSWADAIGLEQSDEQMSEWSFLMSMMIMARRAGTERKVVRRDNASCSCMNTGRRVCGFMLA